MITKLKVLYINACFGVKKIMEPLGISYLVAALRNAEIPNLIAEIYEPSIEGDSIETVAKNVASKHYDYIGLSFIVESVKICKEFICLYKKFGGNAQFIVGGHGPSLSPEKFLVNGVKAVFVGEGEISVPCFFKTIMKGGKLSEIAGIVYRNERNEIIRTSPAQKVIDLDTLPFMARDVLEELCKKYPGEISARIISSRGCYMFCEYCSVRAYGNLQVGKVYRERSVDNLIFEMKFLFEKYHVNQFLFEDDNFLPRNSHKAKEKVDYFCDELLKLNIPNLRLHMQCRPDGVTKYVIDRLKECGLCDLFIGIENINQKDMDFFGRRSNVEQHLSIMRDLHELGFSCSVNSPYRLRIGYIFFNPESTRETLLNSVKFLKRYKVTPKKLVNVLRPYEHTQIYNKFVQRGYLLPDGKIRFANEEIALICETVVQCVREILSFREKIRLPVKLNKELALGYEDHDIIIILDELRIACDEYCYKVTEDIIRAEVTVIPQIVRSSVLWIDEWKANLDIEQKLFSIKKEMGIQGLEKGVYR